MTLQDAPIHVIEHNAPICSTTVMTFGLSVSPLSGLTQNEGEVRTVAITIQVTNTALVLLVCSCLLKLL